MWLTCCRASCCQLFMMGRPSASACATLPSLRLYRRLVVTHTLHMQVKLVLLCL